MHQETCREETVAREESDVCYVTLAYRDKLIITQKPLCMRVIHTWLLDTADNLLYTPLCFIFFVYPGKLWQTAMEN